MKLLQRSKKKHQIYSQVQSNKFDSFSGKFGGKEERFTTRKIMYLIGTLTDCLEFPSLRSASLSETWSVFAAAWSFSASLAPFDCFKMVTREKRKEKKKKGYKYNCRSKLRAFHKTSLSPITTYSHTFQDLLHWINYANVHGWQFKENHVENVAVTFPVRNRALL